MNLTVHLQIKVWVLITKEEQMPISGESWMQRDFHESYIFNAIAILVYMLTIAM